MRVSLPPQKFRELVFELLFLYDFQDCIPFDSIMLLMSEHRVTRRNAALAVERAELMCKRLAEIDTYIQTASTSFSLDRIGKVELAILRMAFFELLFAPEMPKEIIISEAKRIANKFASKEAASFIHGVIDQVLQQHANKKE